MKQIFIFKDTITAQIIKKFSGKKNAGQSCSKYSDGFKTRRYILKNIHLSLLNIR